MKPGMLVRARAPLRLGLAGGGTDVSPYCDQYGGNVLNATIDRYAYAVIRTLDAPVVRFVASDQPATVELPLDARYPLDGPLALHRAPEVGARGERRARAGDHDAPHVPIGARGGADVQECVQQLGRHAVAVVGTVQRQGSDAIPMLVEDGGFAHGFAG